MDLKRRVYGFTLGIRYDRSFRIPDISGEIVDNILYGSKSPFVKGFFTSVQDKSGRERTLFNEKTSEYLRVNTDDIILGVKVSDNFDDRLKWLKNEVLDYYKEVLFKDFEIHNIRRIGVVFHHKFPTNAKFNEIVSNLTDNKVCDADKFETSFSKKMVAGEALYRKGVNDYKNAIYNIVIVGKTMGADLDFQYYYDPSFEDFRDSFPEKVCTDGETFLSSSFYPWLTKYENKKD